jgi:hypothetical protein
MDGAADIKTQCSPPKDHSPIGCLMKYENLLHDFADRTRVNLELIQKAHRTGGSGYEVTQLINSLLGLLVLPAERFSIPQTPLGELIENGWPIPTVHGEFQEATDLRQLVRCLRNAVAHFNIKFSTDRNNNISGITVWNCSVTTNPTETKRVWEATFDLIQLEQIVLRFVELVQENRPVKRQARRSITGGRTKEPIGTGRDIISPK